MTIELGNIEKQLADVGECNTPPLDLWHPELSGSIDIRISRDGHWYHDGTIITRDAMVRLFASILRRESDGEYYLVTPVEKWRIRVDMQPLLVRDVRWGHGDKEHTLQATLNTGKIFDINEQHPLFLEPRMDNIAAIELPHGLAALFTRNAWYQLVELAEKGQNPVVVVSAGQPYQLLE